MISAAAIATIHSCSCVMLLLGAAHTSAPFVRAVGLTCASTGDQLRECSSARGAKEPKKMSRGFCTPVSEVGKATLQTLRALLGAYDRSNTINREVHTSVQPAHTLCGCCCCHAVCLQQAQSHANVHTLDSDGSHGFNVLCDVMRAMLAMKALHATTIAGSDA